MSSPPREPLTRVWLADIAHALRALVATPRYSIPALLSLSLGIAASTAVFAVFSAIVLRPLPFPNEDELVAVHITNSTDDHLYGVSFIYYTEFKEKTAIFSAVAGYDQEGVSVTGSAGVRHAIAAEVTPDFFDTLQVGTEVGRTFTATGASPDPSTVVVLSHSYWISALGGTAIGNTTLVIDGKPRTVVGVVADDHAFPARVDMWFPIELSEDNKRERGRYAMDGLGRLAAGVTVERAKEMLRAAAVAENGRRPGGSLDYATVVPLRRSLLGDKRMSALLMLVAVGAFLLLACANVASLMVTRASLRSRELAVRAAMGASPMTLARQSGLESIVLSVAGGTAGLALAAGFVSAANQLLVGELEYTPARLDLRVLTAFAAIAVVSSIVIGLAPVLFAARVRPMESLREGRSTSSRASRRFRQALVGTQIAMTLVLLVSATTLIRAIAHLQAVKLGVATDAVTARVVFPDSRRTSPERKVAFERAMVERASHLPGVKAAAIARDMPFSNDVIKLGVQLEPNAQENVVTDIRLVGPDYFQAMGIPILSGRAFSAIDSTPGVHHLIVNRAFATQLLGTLAAVGHQLSYRTHLPATTGPDGKPVEGAQIWFDIVGVVEDSLNRSVTKAAAPMVYGDAEWPDAMTLMDSGFSIVVRGESGSDALVAAMTTLVRGVDREVAVYDVDTVGHMAELTYRQRTSLERLLIAFALASILVAMIGLYGVTSYTVAERTSEIGIRRALGASRLRIVRLILKETAVVVASGLAAGVVAALSMRSLLASFLYGVDAADPALYCVVCIGIAAIALLSALAPAWNAAQVLPSRALEVRG